MDKIYRMISIHCQIQLCRVNHLYSSFGFPVPNSEVVPQIDEYALIEEARTPKLDALVRMKLTSNRDQDRVHIRDMISIGMIDESWLSMFSSEPQRRLRELLDDPDG